MVNTELKIFIQKGLIKMYFAENLKIAMESKGINQTQLSELTGLSKSAISQYVSGKRVPAEYAIVFLAEILGVTTEWLTSENEEEIEVETLSNSSDTKVSVLEAAHRLGVGTHSVRAMLQQNRVTWGIAWITSHNKENPRWCYHIARSKFDEYLGTERSEVV